MSGAEPLVLMQLGAQAAGTGISVIGGQKRQKAAIEIAEHDASALEAHAGQQRAVAQLRAEKEREKAERLMGEQRARAAASGGGTGGSIETIIGNTAAQGLHNAELRLWEGEEAARGLETQAAYKRYAAKVGASTQGLETASTILTGVGNMAGTLQKSGSFSRPKFAYGDAGTVRWS